MQIDWTSRGTELDDILRQRIQRHLDKLDRLLGGPNEAHVVTTAEGEGGKRRHVVELVVHSRFGTFASKHDNETAEQAVSDAIHALEKQAHKAHDKVIEARRRTSVPIAADVDV